MAGYFDLNGKVALVTGASRGLGREFATALVSAGATVVLAARGRDQLNALADELKAGGGSAHVVRMDVTDGEDIGTGVEAAISETGGIDILINNAGMTINKWINDFAPAEFDQVITTNLRGAWLVAQRVGRHMIDRDRGGKIVNVTSVLAEVALPGVCVYSMSKAAIVQMTRAMALEWARYDIQVNAIAPGFVETELNREFFSSDVGRHMIDRFPRQRMVQPSDLTGAIVFLASAASNKMTGSVLKIDDGQTLGGPRPRS